ncbi:levanase-like [Oppia nitens]|uniref:levanase-like n=1 Tax=Oppia nitens TaxID=1686743 RepID=UPI0023DC46F5|nr:levanase-like [Oppia nitens]
MFCNFLIIVLLIGLNNCEYDEDYRQQIHYSVPKGWTNDPNGLVYYKDTYHLFYQYCLGLSPDGGKMHWGHAISKDLFHWQNLPIALYPQVGGRESIWSGSAIVDVNNVTGFAAPGAVNKTMIAFFSGFNDTDGIQDQWLAYSADEGLTWKYYDSNPVIPNPTKLRDYRDPKVLQFKDHYALIFAAGNHVNLYKSYNLKVWQFIQEFGAGQGSHESVWECPDLYPLNVTINGTIVEKWILTVNLNSKTQYFVGTFDGKQYRNDNSPDTVQWLDYGADNYAGVTYNTVPNNGRRVFIGWSVNPGYAVAVPTNPWRGGMTVPRELSLVKTTDNKLRLAALPVPEISNIVQNTTIILVKPLKPNETLNLNADQNIKSRLLDIELEVDMSSGRLNADKFGLQFKGSKDVLRVYFDGSGNKFVVDRNSTGRHEFSKSFVLKSEGPRLTTGSVITMRLVLDVASVELFADNGLTTITDTFYSTDSLNTNINLFYESTIGTSVLKVNRVYIRQLNSVWNNKFI